MPDQVKKKMTTKRRSAAIKKINEALTNAELNNLEYKQAELAIEEQYLDFLKKHPKRGETHPFTKTRLLLLCSM